MRLAAIVGPLFSISLLFRLTSLFLVYGAIGTAIVIGGWGVLAQIYHRIRTEPSSKVASKSRANNRLAIRLLLISVVPIFTMLSWSWVVTDKAHPAKFSYTVNVAELNSMIWRSNEQLLKINASWLIDASANWACRIDKETCAKISRAEAVSPRPWAGAGIYSIDDYQRLAIVAALKNPVGYIADRAPKAWHNWSSGNPAQGLLFLLTSMAAITVAGSRIIRKRDFQAFIFMGLIFTATAPMLKISVQDYYFIPIQIGSIFYLLINQNVNYLIGCRKSTVLRSCGWILKYQLIPKHLN